MSKSEWLEPDGQGGFASGTTTGIRTRRYHALLLAARTPPTNRVVLVNGFDAWVENSNGTFMLSSQFYAPGVPGGDGWRRIVSFTSDPWPAWKYRLDDGTEIEHEIVAGHRSNTVVLTWRLLKGSPGAKLFIRPFLSGRDYHALQRENPAFRFEPTSRNQQLIWETYPGLPHVVSYTNGSYHHDPQWYRNFLYEEERLRGLDHLEDLASPGIFAFGLSQRESVWLLSTEETSSQFQHDASPPLARAHSVRANERLRRQSFASALHRAADAYIVDGARGKTVLAGYPWFTDWGRDTFISLRGLCLATGRLQDARDILLSWSEVVSEGMLPNRFPDSGEKAEYNAVDASLWFIIAAYEFLDAARKQRFHLNGEKRKLLSAIDAILEGYSRGTRFGIRQDVDGLLAAGMPGVQLTWMDAKVGDWVVTPRIGKPVEVQALWLNALWIGSRWNSKWKLPFVRGSESFRARFWNNERGILFDVVDANHTPGSVDPTFRPNQIFAVGGLPLNLLEIEQARMVVKQVEDHLFTSMGLRSLAPTEPGYVGRYEGGVAQRDGCYHQGTVWPWLLGPFIEAWLRVRGNTNAARLQAHSKFLAPLLALIDEGGTGHIPEIADAEPPHDLKGCPFQAWSVGEALRVQRLLELSAEMAAPKKRLTTRKKNLAFALS
jgi:predicted glycogen debranching enzyme